MKKAISTFFFLLLISLGVLLAVSIAQKHENKVKQEENRRELPKITLQGLQGESYSLSGLPEDRPLLLIYFHSDCTYCQYEATLIRDSLHLFSEAHVIFVSDEHPDQIQAFGEAYDILGLPGLMLLHSPDKQASEIFNTGLLPSIFIYDQQHQLVKYFKGEVKLESLLFHLFPQHK